ncbi:hypothetical protein [Brevibacillus laterosporus]|uniref:hypothetical protein n=1 Tax=Brevibacillus laterosporus TaxID=1465 RepID=UPI00215B784F|nr:hypothetical protein [Brevibacillus laterosporus]MCR8994622.1 hypothetical protein [Brevibacillus laterosporus]
MKTQQTGIKNALIGWQCACGIHRNKSTEVWEDCVCRVKHVKEQVEESNSLYWKKFWNRV